MEVNWPNEYHQLTRIEELLRCGICYEYIQTSVITPCSHNYCSVCIRKYLQFKTLCPDCFQTTYEKDLHPNRVLDELKESFLMVREKLISCIQGCTVVESNDAPIKPARSNHNVRTPQKSSPFKTPTNSSAFKKTPQKDVPGPSTSHAPKVPSIFTLQTTPKRETQTKENRIKVPCPVCAVQIPQITINRHLDDCLKRRTSSTPPKSIQQERKRLPKIVIELLKDSELKKWLKQYGLSATGDSRTLKKRIKRFTVLYNAECDKLEPRPVAEVVMQCEEEELREKREQSHIPPKNRLQVDRKAAPDVIEAAQKKYLETHKDNYRSMIQSMKERNKPTNKSRKHFVPEESDTSTSTSTKYKNPYDSVFPPNDESNESFPPCSLELSQFATQDSDSNASCPLQRYSADDPTSFLTIEMMTDSDRSKQSSSRTSWKESILESTTDELNQSRDNTLDSEEATNQNNNLDPCIIVSNDSSSQSNDVESLKHNIPPDDDIYNISTDGGLNDSDSTFDINRKGKKIMKKRAIMRSRSGSYDSETDPEEVFAPAGRKPTKMQKQREKDGKVLAMSIAADFAYDLSSNDETNEHEAKQKLALDTPAPSCSKQDKENAESPTSGVRNSTRRSSRKRNYVPCSSSKETIKLARKIDKVTKVLDEQNENGMDVINLVDDIPDNFSKLTSGKRNSTRKSSNKDIPAGPPKRTLRNRTKNIAVSK